MADINVWLALSDTNHGHSNAAWQWFRTLRNEQVCFCRLSQLGLLRLLTTPAVMGEACLTLKGAWAIYDQWLLDSHVTFRHEPAEVELQFRAVTARLAHASAPKALADCYLLAMSQAAGANLVTFDSGLHRLAHNLKHEGVLLR